jgi:cytosine/adenosine deaminase-related metal-dependent hydrolase
VSIVYRAKYVLPMGDAEPIENGEVWVEGGRIREVGQGIASRHPELEVVDLGRAAVLPGFVNAHSHIDYTLSRNTCDSLNLWQWLHRVGFRRGKVPDYEVILASARVGAAECARSGITCIGDCSFSGAAARAIDETGLRGIVYKELFGQSMGSEYTDIFAGVLDEVRQMQAGASKRVRIGISPHTVYTTNPEVLRLCAESCTHLNMPVSMHLAETSAEEEYMLTGTGPLADWRRELGYEPMASGLRPVQVLERAGLLREGVTLAHCVHLAPDEIDLIAASGASVVHCPRSNAYLGAGVCDLPAFRAAGATLGLGTDSAASCLTLDFFEEMRFAVGLQRARAEDAAVLSAKDVLDLATRGGAEALGLGDEIGRLNPGMRADMIAVDVRDALPGENVHLAVLSRSPADIVLRLVDGKPVEPDVEARTAELAELMEQQGIA